MTKEEKINEEIARGCDTNLISDGYHTFGELYDHRITVFIALCRKIVRYEPQRGVWRSRFHSDGSGAPDWFVLGIGTAAGEQITYHLPASRWDETGFARELERSPEFDGHSGADTLRRIAGL
ncbi:MAG: hypothetical protein IPN69_01735 [Acidobacteria bacterium]|nr:hypothetical protein [Acidobacteriota bacterium]